MCSLRVGKAGFEPAASASRTLRANQAAPLPGGATIVADAFRRSPSRCAAPVGVAAAAGLHVSRLDGSPLVYNQPDPYLPDLLICRPELAERLLTALAELIG